MLSLWTLWLRVIHQDEAAGTLFVLALLVLCYYLHYKASKMEIYQLATHSDVDDELLHIGCCAALESIDVQVNKSDKGSSGYGGFPVVLKMIEKRILDAEAVTTNHNEQCNGILSSIPFVSLYYYIITPPESRFDDDFHEKCVSIKGVVKDMVVYSELIDRFYAEYYLQVVQLSNASEAARLAGMVQLLRKKGNFNDFTVDDLNNLPIDLLLALSIEYKKKSLNLEEIDKDAEEELELEKQQAAKRKHMQDEVAAKLAAKKAKESKERDALSEADKREKMAKKAAELVRKRHNERVEAAKVEEVRVTAELADKRQAEAIEMKRLEKEAEKLRVAAAAAKAEKRSEEAERKHKEHKRAVRIAEQRKKQAEISKHEDELAEKKRRDALHKKHELIIAEEKRVHELQAAKHKEKVSVLVEDESDEVRLVDAHGIPSDQSLVSCICCIYIYIYKLW